MGEDQPLKLNVLSQEADPTGNSTIPSGESLEIQGRDRKWWLRVSIYAVLVLTGETVGTLLGRLYYDKGGNSKWVSTLVQIAGFPILLPCYLLSALRNPNPPHTKPGNAVVKASLVYTLLGLLNAAVCLFHSVGLFHLQVSTYSLICATQLSFSAFFSFFLNSQKLTPYIVNSLVLLTVSSVLLLFQADVNDPVETTGRNHALGFVCTVLGSAGYGLVLSLTQFSLQRVLKREANFSACMDMTVYVSLVSTIAAFAGLFGSGDWKVLGPEMEGFELGKASYALVLTFSTVAWQLVNLGAVGLILEVSSLFSNVISVLSLPVVPVLAVVFFRDRIDGVKVVAMVLALWGLMSYVYQHYLESKIKPELDHHESKGNDTEISNGVSVIQF